MTFQSILFERPAVTDALEAPAFFGDLHLDQIVEAITADWKEYDLAPFFYARLNDLDAIIYRQEIMRELESNVLIEEISAFSKQMRTMRERLEQAEKFDDYKYTRQRCFLTAAQIYCAGVEQLSKALSALDLKSPGFRAFRNYLNDYVTSNFFRQLVTQTQRLQSDLSVIRYGLLIRDGGVTVRHCEAEGDYSYTIEQTFRKFKQRGPQNYMPDHLRTMSKRRCRTE